MSHFTAMFQPRLDLRQAYTLILHSNGQVHNSVLLYMSHSKTHCQASFIELLLSADGISVARSNIQWLFLWIFYIQHHHYGFLVTVAIIIIIIYHAYTYTTRSHCLSLSAFHLRDLRTSGAISFIHNSHATKPHVERVCISNNCICHQTLDSP